MDARIPPSELPALASAAIAEGTEREILPALLQAADQFRDASLYQWGGLLYRSLDELGPAIEAFETATRLAPGDGLIALSRARVELEAGLDARRHFTHALGLMPSGGTLLGRAAAHYAMGEGPAALDELAAILAGNPAWTEGHRQWAQLAAMTGQAARATETAERAVSGNPGSVQAWQVLIEILTRADRHAEAAERCKEAMRATAAKVPFTLSLAAALSDSQQLDRAGDAFNQLGEPADVHHAVHLARYLIRSNDLGGLLALTDRWMMADDGHHFWPYASIAWRLTDDPRWQWLEGDDRLVRIIDLSPDIGPINALADHLRDIHDRSGRFLDQSVRGGTQTDGALLSRISPEIRQLRSAIVTAVEEYRAQLPPIDPTHPMLRYRRDKEVRFAGSWSVRLAGSGHHSNHIHPAGWISSAFYVATPETMDGQEGWLTLGEPQAGLGSSLPPFRTIRPQPGQLVLFPSMMWHGTNPFPKGERMTVAFDVATPR